MDTVVLYDGSSSYNHYQVVDAVHNGRQARLLIAGGTAPQSGLALDGNPELLFHYNQRFLEIAESIHPANVLIIGGGAFTLPQALLERFPDIHIDAVEIDPLLPQLAKEYFGLSDDPRLNIAVGDGREYIERSQEAYDMIGIDAFTTYDIPRSLLAVEAAQQYADRLVKDGVVAINFIAKYLTYETTLAHQLLATFQQVFRTVELYPSNPHSERHLSQNIMLVASNQDALSLDYLQSAPIELLFTPEDAVLHSDE